MKTKHFDHVCCWNQGTKPACGQSLDVHEQCCLCGEEFAKDNLQKEKNPTEAILSAIEDLKNALLADMEVSKKLVEINREKTATHYNLMKAKERLYNLDIY